MKHCGQVSPWLQRTALAIAIAGANSLAMAQSAPEDGDIEEVIVTGSLSNWGAIKNDIPIMELARSVSIETQQDLLDKGALNLADAYVYSAGVTGEVFGFATRGDWVRVRGLDVPEYRDSLQALFGNYNNTRPDIYTLEQVEILKGPASVLYGQGSPGGIVNVVSKLAGEGKDSEVVVDGGNFNRKQLAADLNGSITSDLHYRIVGLYRDADTQVDNVQDESLVLSPSLTWTPGDNTRLSILATLQDIDSDTGAQFHPIAGTLLPAPNGERIPFDAYTGETGFNRYETESQSLTFLLEHRLNDVWTVESTARWTKGESDYRQAWVSFIGGDRYVYNADGSLYKDGTVPRSFYAAEGESEQLAIDTRARATFSTGPADHQLMIGLQYQDVETDQDSAYLYAIGYDFVTRGPDAIYGDRFWINTLNPSPTGQIPPQEAIDAFWFDGPTATTTDLGFYINDHIAIDNWHLTLGLRRDEVSTDNGTTDQDDSATSLSVGLLYDTKWGFSPYVSYAESFEPVVGVDMITGGAFDPQEGEQVEYGVKYTSDDGRVFVTLAYYDIEISNLDNPNSLPNAPSQQEGVSEIDGLELEASLRLGDFSVEFNASTIDTKNPNGFQFASVPEEQVSTFITWRPQGKLQGFRSGVGVRYVGESSDGADSLTTPDYTLGDLMLGYRMDAWDFSFNVRNIADKEYESTCLARGDCFLGESRTVVGRVSYRF